ncbi:hypothetical protein [Kocuria marina]|uniref:hypothetical protein n=1 Tax=Kocuria marina TaxID=223184 RepID=UPI000BF10CA2
MVKSLPSVVGSNVRAVRVGCGLTLGEVVEAARAYGVRWSTGRLARIERGDGAVTVETLLVLSLTLSQVAGREVTPGSLLASAVPVEVGEGVAVRAGALVDALEGRKTELVLSDVEGAVEDLAATTDAVMRVGQRLADERAARKLGWSDDEVLRVSWSLWRRPLSAEAKARAGEDATPQKVGHATRELLEELKAAGRGDD